MRGLELNGVANIKAIMDSAKMDMPSESEALILSEEQVKSVYNQLKTLERYMIAMYEHAKINAPIPYWSEVRDKPEMYTTYSERFNSTREDK